MRAVLQTGRVGGPRFAGPPMGADMIPTSRADDPCGVLVKTYEGVSMPCVRPKGHKDGHNPFSNTPPLTEVQPK